MFQDDIFPPCSSGKPALSAEEWASGTNKDPLLVAFSSDGIKDVDPAKCQVVSHSCTVLEIILSIEVSLIQRLNDTLKYSGTSLLWTLWDLGNCP